MPEMSGGGHRQRAAWFPGADRTISRASTAQGPLIVSKANRYCAGRIHKPPFRKRGVWGDFPVPGRTAEVIARGAGEKSPQTPLFRKGENDLGCFGNVAQLDHLGLKYPLYRCGYPRLPPQMESWSRGRTAAPTSPTTTPLFASLPGSSRWTS